MDNQTFEKFFENENGKPTNNSTILNLTPIEQQLYEKLRTNNWRLEQEKIPLNYTNEIFNN
jgi:hypothetical protein